MNAADIHEVIADGMLAIVIASGPVLALALGVGLVIALVQALTQIQEMTLTFVPKIVVIFLGLAAALPFMFGVLAEFALALFDRVAAGGL
mgnify:CR=1 FL=1